MSAKTTTASEITFQTQYWINEKYNPSVTCVYNNVEHDYCGAYSAITAKYTKNSDGSYTIKLNSITYNDNVFFIFNFQSRATLVNLTYNMANGTKKSTLLVNSDGTQGITLPLTINLNSAQPSCVVDIGYNGVMAFETGRTIFGFYNYTDGVVYPLTLQKLTIQILSNGNLEFSFDNPQPIYACQGITPGTACSPQTPVPRGNLWITTSPSDIIYEPVITQSTSCSDYNATGTYPNCTCVDASKQWNSSPPGCFAIGPTCAQYGATGTYPNCICPEDTVWNQTASGCVACTPCPTNSQGQCKESTGCSCINPYSTYDPTTNTCKTKSCPNSNQTYPSCTCDSGYSYDQANNVCTPTYSACPNGATGVPPFCNCGTGYTYSVTQNTCNSTSYTTCPNNATGTFPNCTCTTPGYSYNPTNNTCVPIYSACPNGATGVPPYCNCGTGYTYSVTQNTCNSSSTTTTTTPWYKEWWVWLGVIVIILIIVMGFRK